MDQVREQEVDQVEDRRVEDAGVKKKKSLDNNVKKRRKIDKIKNENRREEINRGSEWRKGLRGK